MKIFLSILCCISFLFGASNIQEEIANNFGYNTNVHHDFDPLSGYNKIMTNINDKFYMDILFPIAKGYKRVIPLPARTSVSNFFNNLLFPVRFVNNILQFKFKNSIDECERFIINSTIGIGGLFDVAGNKFKIHPHYEDFGLTLGHYGIGEGFYIVWPLIGPSDLRDSIGMIADGYINPAIYIKNRAYNIIETKDESYELNSFHTLNKTSFDYKKYESLKAGNVLLYPVLKETYEAYRKKLIREGKK